MSGWRRWILIPALMMLLACPMGWAYEPKGRIKGHDEMDELMTRYNLPPMFQKLGRGAGNLFGGWLEIPLNIGKRHSQTDTVGSLVTGAAVGMFKGLIRTGVGVFEVVTFVLPLPEDYAPILPTLEYYQKTPKRAPLFLE